MRSRRGFSLVELMMVIAILGLMAAYVSLNMDGVTAKRRFQSQVRQLGATVEWARGGAIGRGKPYKMIYDLDNQEYWIMIPIEPEEGAPPGQELEYEILGEKFEVLSSVKIRSLQFPGGEQETNGEVEIYFTPKGTEGSHIVILERTDIDAEPVSIRFNAIIGSASVARGEQEFKVLE